MQKLAGINDLRLELWLRLRNAGEIVWKTKDGSVIPVKEMTDEHLENTIKMIERKDAYRDQNEYYQEFWIDDDIMDRD